MMEIMESLSGKLRSSRGTDTILRNRSSLKVFRKCSGSLFGFSSKVVSLTVVVLCLSFALETHAEFAHNKVKRSSHPHRQHHGLVPRLNSKRYSRDIDSPFYNKYTYESDSMHQNLHKPDFVDCSNYKPSIPEAMPVGTPVIQVIAIDNDPPNSGGNVTYSIVSGNEIFSFAIDENTGWITTKKIFDRDEPSREKEVYVTVRASDNGNPVLDAVCTMKVQITDINDNAAQFLLSRRFQSGNLVPEHEWNPDLDRYEYRESMPQDLEIGQVVMRISATDIDDGNNGTVVYRIEPHKNAPQDAEYFEISQSSGEIKLKQKIPPRQKKFQLRINASDMGEPPLSTATDLSIIVTDPQRRTPEFISPVDTVTLSEFNYNLSIPVATFNARSNADDEIVFFELVNGQTQPTNKDAIFTLETEGRNKAFIKLDRQLDYEAVTKYTLTVRASNKYDLATETVLTVEVIDQNDEKPYFTEVTTGTVLEQERNGTTVMRVRAIDTDGTSPNNEVEYYLKKDEDSNNFRIDRITGEITTNAEFDREFKDTYQVTVYARDGSPSVLTNNGAPNERPQTLKIVIADKNDNPPVFVKNLYEAEMSEDADLKDNAVVIEVKAIDKDTASKIEYSITEGNTGDAFAISSTSTSGIISVKNQLDYETQRRYDLTVRASDSVYEAYTKVTIFIQNVNDRTPEFERMVTTTTIREETVPTDCIFRVKAFDPDIGDRTLPQNISYFIDSGKEFFTVGEQDGCVKVIKPLDRETLAAYHFRVGAADELGMTTTKLKDYIDLTVNLTDINDNAPKLTISSVIWMENRASGTITSLDAIDDDDSSAGNGPPFTFQINQQRADPEVRQFFSIEGKLLIARKENFNREERKEYIIPIDITDSGHDRKTGTSFLTVIIGDENDEPMMDGTSKIFVYKYKEKSAFRIGRVYVEDKDDWDLPDKTFTFASTISNQFTVDQETGYINMLPSTQEGTYNLTFSVYDSKWDNQVTAKVHVTVKQITDEAVDSSGSIRLKGSSKETFITPDQTGVSNKDRLQSELAKIFGVPVENVDVFTVGNSPEHTDTNVFDVRYSVHNSPYYKPEKLDGLLAEKTSILEKLLGLEVVMVGIDECIVERQVCASCYNKLGKRDSSATIFTNTSSFVGVYAFVQPTCGVCASSDVPSDCSLSNPCLNHGICKSEGGVEGFTCECTAGFTGPRCEITSISMDGNGYAWFPALSVCEDSNLEVHIMTLEKNGLVFYNGPIAPSKLNVTDFMSLELKDGKPLLLADYGTGVSRIELAYNVADGKHHKILMSWSPSMISMTLDECIKQEQSCFRTVRPAGIHTQLNVNGPLQLGGLSFSPKSLQPHMKWAHIPTEKNFVGCIGNLTYNKMFYDLGSPSYHTINITSCHSAIPLVGTTIVVGINFWIIIIICLLIVIFLIAGFLFYRKKRNYEEVKGELENDIRENIINYSDEGGGEGDQTGYDLSVLLKPANGPSYITSPTDKIPMETMHPHTRMPDNGDNPDIQSFLQGNKQKVDNDPDGLPYDDVRNYAYEGDGNSMGSLSSLASGTDDGDLNFDYLPTFGPRFKKLADMYGGQSSDDESFVGPPPEAWC